MGLNMKEKQAVTKEYKPRYQKAAEKGLTPGRSLYQRVHMFITDTTTNLQLTDPAAPAPALAPPPCDIVHANHL